MKKITTILLILLFSVTGLGCSSQPPAATPIPILNDTTGNITAAVPTITVSGKGELSLIPDKATIQLGVQVLQQPSATAAMEAVAAVIENIEAALTRLGASPEDMQTSSFSMYEDYKYDSKGNIIGKPRYNVNNTISLTLYDIENIGQYIDAAIDAGATNSYGIEFSIKNPAAREEEALALALENAKSRAEALAAACGKSIGDVIQLNDGTQITEQVYSDVSPGMPVDAMADSSRASKTTMLPGTFKLTANVSARFILQ